MIIKSVLLVNFKKYVGTYEFSGFQQGICKLIEPNEFGKSTVLEALRAIILYKHRSTIAARTLAPHGESGLKAEVTLNFTAGGVEWSVYKKFAGASGRAKLTGNGGVHEGDAAEEMLETILGIDMSGQTGKAGVWGALWVGQTESMTPPPLDDAAKLTLSTIIEAQVGQVTGGQRGQRILAKVRSELDGLVGKNGNPVQKYREAKQAVIETSAVVEQARSVEREILSELERLDELQEKLTSPAAKESLRQLKADAEESEAAAAVAEGIQVKADLASETALRLEADVVNLTKQIEQRQAFRDELRIDNETSAKLLADLQAAEAELLELSSIASAATVECQKTQKAMEGFAAGLQTAKKVVLIAEASGDLTKYEGIMVEAERLSADCDVLDAVVKGNPATKARLVEIERLFEESAKATALLSASSPIIEFDIAQNDLIKIDGEEFTAGRKEVSAPEIVEIQTAGGSIIRVRPPTTASQNDLRKKSVDALAKATLSLDAVNSSSLAEAHRRQTEREDVAEKHRIAKDRLDRLVLIEDISSSSLADLRRTVAEKQSSVTQTMKELGLAAAPSAAEAKRALEVAAEALERSRELHNKAVLSETSAKAEHTSQQTKVSGIKDRFTDTVKQIERKSAALQVDLAAGDDMELQSRLSSSKTEAETHREEVTKLIDGIDLSGAKANARRLRSAYDQLVSNRFEMDKEKHGLESAIGAKRGSGENLAKAEADLVSAKLRDDRMTEQAEIATLLVSVLGDSEKEAKDRYIAPVRTLVMGTLGKLLPGSVANMNLDMEIESISRNGVDEKITSLSTGASEQLAVLVRLAFAEMLVQNQKPAMLILDDALVYSDDPRLDRMFDILDDASTRMQIIVLSCHDRMWDRIGGSRIKVAKLSAV